MKYVVNAVVVTCNRCELLKMAISHLKEQSYQINKIIVVNNASNDGTAAYLESEKSDLVYPVHREINEGGAGGFYYGIKKAYEIGCDFVWIMDDDTIAERDALEKLLYSYDILQDRPIGFLASNVLFKDNKPCYMNICNTEFVWNEYAAEGIIKISHSSFVSMLIPEWVIKEVGYPIKEYFIWGDDGEYSTRILQKYEGYLCGKSIVYHYMNENIGVDIMNVSTDRLERFFYFYRNWMCTNRMRGKAEERKFLKDTRRLITIILKSNTSNKVRKIQIIRDGIKAGKKFNVQIIYPEGKKEGIQENNRRLKYKIINRAFRIFRYFGIKYDIKTQGYVGYCRKLFDKYRKINPSIFQKGIFILKGYFKTCLYNTGNKIQDLDELLTHCDIKLCKSKYFAYSVDVYKSWKLKTRQMANCTVDYDLIVNNSLFDLKMKDSQYGRENNEIIDIIERYIIRLKNAVRKSSHKNKKQILEWLNNIETSKAKTLPEAMQRILLVNQLLWQTDHIQMGLGRLDHILGKFADESIKDGYLEDLVSDFISVLHNYYWYKSEEMPGDTGQIIILGGENNEGKYISNRLTFAFINCVKKLQLPDPKILLRVNKQTSLELWRCAIECLATGIGCPLFSNDDRVIPALVQYGYGHEDARNYVTSACWEIIPGNSCEQNNIGVFNFAEAFDLLARKEDLDALDTWDKFIYHFSLHLCGHVNYMLHLLDNIKWEKDPLLSFFKESCRNKQLDISEGGGKYNNYGILSLAISNTVNSLINIRRYVYIEKKYTLKELYLIRNKNFEGNEECYKLFKNNYKYFGTDDEKEDVIGLTNWLLMRVNETVEKYRNHFGDGVKFGLSSPGYIQVGQYASATFDGRRDKEPYNVHISADGNSNLTALMNFASSINYGRAGFNGNVVDLMVNPQFINDNMEKFVLFMVGSVASGVFQIQINVINSKVLIEAKKNPDKFPNLIVRVWGFSAYFKELPEEYKDYIIERAKLNEAINY